MNGIGATKLPQGFRSSVTYSGMDSRLKVDTAMIRSEKECYLLRSVHTRISCTMTKVLIWHHGIALPQGRRGSEITGQLCAAADAAAGVHGSALLASGSAAGHFRPSRLVDSFPSLAADLNDDGAEALASISAGKILTVSGCGSHVMAVVAAPTVAGKGVALFLTDTGLSGEEAGIVWRNLTDRYDFHDYDAVLMAVAAERQPHLFAADALALALESMGVKRCCRTAS
ncbi:hypothetical protein [Megasphaera vaginalis (ex Bordigoni et al. 2020)]|uniref:hypothetical protein n=1 Tax=Megasphaera vaginalis (ex Bordigoni et al. 2020) TaxID=2045301 RepID=UPI000C7A3B87|nr:hypothetical protein [Megasphaera vaginalis (ex Bordigoni et al. 2020)]